jgi:hypothetical protein
MGIVGFIRDRLERYAEWNSKDYLNSHLARRLGHAKGTTYPWRLLRNDNYKKQAASWWAFMRAADPGKLIAYTEVHFDGRKVIVGASFDYTQSFAPDVPPMRITNTEVLPGPLLFSSDWVRTPALFHNPAEFAQLAAQY